MNGSLPEKVSHKTGIQPFLILFDGVCNLCNRSVDFIIRHDLKRRFRFLSLQSEPGKRLVLKYGIPDNMDSVILIGAGRVYFASDAAIMIAEILGYPWKMATALRIIPKRIRDIVYFSVAKNRYRWFGKRNSCRVPSAEEKLWFPEDW